MDKRFGQLVRKYRLENELTYKGLGELLNLSPGYLSDIENANRYAPRGEVLEKIIDVLKLPKPEAYDFASATRDELPEDVVKVIMENPKIIQCIRNEYIEL
jgi:transcriptional regulator with XRE-family HTH domain